MKIQKNKITMKQDSVDNLFSICGGTTPSTAVSEYWLDGTIPWIGPVDMNKPGKYISRGRKNITSCAANKIKSKKILKNSIIISTRAPIGYIKINSNDIFTNQGCHSLHIKGENITDYFYYFFLNNISVLKSISTGTTFQEISKKNLSSLNINYPDLKQQKNIAYVLSKQEKQIETIKRLIKNIEKRNQYYSEKLLSGEIKINDQTSELEFYQSYSNFDNYLTVDQLVSYLPKSKIKTGEANKENINKFPFFNCSKEQNLYLDYSICSNENIFLSTGGSANVHYYNGEAAYSTDVLAITNTKEVECYYLYNLFNINIKLIEKCFQGSGLKHLNKKDFKKIKLPIPTKDEQKKISSFLVKKEQELFTLKKIQQKEEKRFQWMLDNLLSGEYEVIDED